MIVFILVSLVASLHASNNGVSVGFEGSSGGTLSRKSRDMISWNRQRNMLRAVSKVRISEAYGKRTKNLKYYSSWVSLR